MDVHAVALFCRVQEITWDLSSTKYSLQTIDDRQGRKTYGHTAVRHAFWMTQFYTCELSNTLNDRREILILDIHGQAVLIESNLGILGQWLGRFRRRRGSTPRSCGRWYATPGRTWRFSLGASASRQTEAEKEAEDTSPADERLFRPNHTAFLHDDQT